VKLIMQAILTLSVPVLVLGCAVNYGMNEKNLGSLRENPEVTRQYENLSINPDYDYYYYGREIQPDTIMGIKKGYTVQSAYWHPVDLTRETLEKWVVWGKRETDNPCASRRYMGRYVGSDILDPGGTIVGDWYSRRDWGIFEFPGGNTMIPHPPRNHNGWSLATCT